MSCKGSRCHSFWDGCHWFFIQSFVRDSVKYFLFRWIPLKMRAGCTVRRDRSGEIPKNIVLTVAIPSSGQDLWVSGNYMEGFHEGLLSYFPVHRVSLRNMSRNEFLVWRPLFKMHRKVTYIFIKVLALGVHVDEDPSFPCRYFHFRKREILRLYLRKIPCGC